MAPPPPVSPSESPTTAPKIKLSHSIVSYPYFAHPAHPAPRSHLLDMPLAASNTPRLQDNSIPNSGRIATYSANSPQTGLRFSMRFAREQHAIRSRVARA